jgi:hypothetical protein
VVCNSSTGNNRKELLTEYESVTQKVSSSIESTLQNTKQLSQCVSSFILLFAVSRLQGHGNPDDNLESQNF